MDKRQAVEFLEYLRQDRNLERTIYGDALNMAIDALKAQLSQEGTTKDAISRQQAIDALKMDISIIPFAKAREYVRAAIETIYNRLEELPRVQPKTHEERTETHACDCISRQAAIDAVEKNACNTQRIMDAVNNLPSAQPEPQWIPVSERLPEVHESGNSVSGIYMQSNPVLVYGTCEYEDNAQFHVVTYCDDLDGNTYWSTELDAITVSGVIAWMPLPEPWRGDAE